MMQEQHGDKVSGKGDNRVPSWKSKEGHHITGDNIYEYFKDFALLSTENR